MAMAHGVETRSPFLDYRVVELASRLPISLKMKVLKEKYLLRRCAEGIVPASLVNRSKQPYQAPEGAVFFTKPGRVYTDDLLSDATLRRTGIFQPNRVRRLVQKFRDGRAIGTGDNMALVGIVSTQLLAEYCRSGFAKQL